MREKASQVCRFVKDEDANLLFPPVVVHEEQAQADLNAILAGDPALYGIQQTRWTLESLLSVVQNKGYLVSKIGSLQRLLSRLGLRLVRARYAYRSPDPHYQAKLDYIAALLKRVKASQGREVALYLDECTYYRQPLLAPCWTRSDQHQEKVKRSYRSDTTRVEGGY